MKTVSYLTSFAALALAAISAAAEQPSPSPGSSGEEPRATAADVTVARIDFIVPSEEGAAERSLAERFFNKPEEQRFSTITTENWQSKWRLFSDALIANAKAQRLDFESLERCLRSLNYGRNRQTMLWPAREQRLFPRGTPPEEIAAFEKDVQEKYQRALKERDENPEAYYDLQLAVVPVAAYLARHAEDDCWIIVCKWEAIDRNGATPLGHVMVWALDTKTCAVVAYTSCD